MRAGDAVKPRPLLLCAVPLLLQIGVVPVRALASEGCHRRADTLGWYVPDHAKVQTGGYLGMATVGVGYTALRVLDFDLYYGWVPEFVGGVDIQSLAIRVSGHVKGICLTPDVNWIYISGGLGMVMTFGDGFFVLNPSRYPAGYYPITALRNLLTVGTAIEFQQPEHRWIAHHGAFLEFAALDQYVRAWLQSPKTIAAWEPWSMSLGYKLGF